jgi:hypothetical protein
MAGPDRIVNEVCVQRKRSTKSSNRTPQQKNNLALVEKGSVRTGKIATKIDPRRAGRLGDAALPIHWPVTLNQPRLQRRPSGHGAGSGSGSDS